MAKICKPELVNLIVGVISCHKDLFYMAESELENLYGTIDLQSEFIPFTFTDYYNAEMGDNLLRKFLSFKTLIDPSKIALIKVATNDLESKISDNNKYNVFRAINLDPGYICNSKLILATTKDYSHRIYLRSGIFAEITLQYHSRFQSYKPQPWTFPDYSTKEYINFFNKVRLIYSRKLK